jgi:cysteine desulfurase
MKRVYLDYAAATPVHEDVYAAMRPYWETHFGNPSAIHTEGQTARKAVDTARKTVARCLGVRQENVIFTAGGTESNNIALQGYVETLHANGRPYSDMHLITTPIEHPATLETAQYLATRGVRVEYMPVDECGRVHPDDVASLLCEDTVLVSVAHVNSEVGVIQPTAAIARKIRSWNRVHSNEKPVRLHVDAAQSPLWLACEPERIGADMMSFDAGKFEGPKGAGVLAFARERIVQFGTWSGGGQEFGVRPGTEATASIVGVAAALTRAQTGVKERSTRVAAVRDKLCVELMRVLPQAVLNGPKDMERVANNVHISIPGLDTEYAAITLDAHGYAVSTKSACSSGDSSASSVVYSMTHDAARAQSTLRLTLGPHTTWADVRGVPEILRELSDKMKPFSPRA